MNLIPSPESLRRDDGRFVLLPRALILADAPFQAVAEYLAALLRAPTGYPIPVKTAASSARDAGAILFRTGGASLGQEGYELEITADAVVIHAIAPAGAFYACQTILQLFPSSIFSKTPSTPEPDWALPCLRMMDRPRFPWRGLMLDPAREFLTPDFLKRYIDLLALYKFNRLHLHLTDDQAWTLEIKKYPTLTDAGRRVWKDQDRVRGIYTQEQMREIVAYAAERFITVIPELEMPAHSVAALESMRELLCSNNPWRLPSADWTKMPEGLVEFCMGSETTFEFFENVLTEIMDIFPSQYIHIGGDEYYGDAWSKCPQCQKRQAGLVSEDSREVAAFYPKCKGHPKKYLLYRYGMRRVAEFVASRGRTPMMWDDLSWQGTYPKGVCVNQWHYDGGYDYWQNVNTPGDPGIEAATHGHDVVVSSFSHLYFDYTLADISFRKVYKFEPIALKLPQEFNKHILGVHAPVWNQPPKHVDDHAFPRILALAEIAWTPMTVRNWEEFSARARQQRAALDQLQVAYAPGDFDNTVKK